MKMDVSKFKKVSSDSKKTVLKHPRGHEIVIAHDALSKTNLNQLKSIPALYNIHGPGEDLGDAQKMAAGGGVGDENHPMFRGVKTKIANWAGDGNPGPQKDLPQDIKGRPDESGIDRSEEVYDPEAYKKMNGPVESEDIRMARGGAVRRYASGTPDAPVGDGPKKFDAIQKPLGANREKYMSQMADIPVPADQADPSTQGAIGPQSPLATPVTQDEASTLTTAGSPLPVPSPYSMPGGMANIDQGFRTQLEGLNKQQQGAAGTAQANIDLNERQAGTMAESVNQINTINNNYQRAYGDIANERKSLMQEAASGAAHLDPQRFIKNMSTGNKILSGIGLILGGIGSGMTHQPNLAAEFLMNNINKDVENQRLQLGVKQNLLNFNFQQTKDLRDATDFTKLNMMDMVGLQLKQQAALAQNPLQRAALLNNAGIIDQKAGELQTQIAFRRAQMQIQMGANTGGPNSEQTFQQQNAFLRTTGEQGEKIAKDRESKHVGGVGQASREVPADVMTQITARNALNDAVNDLQKFASAHSGSFSPEDIAQGRAKAALVQDMVRQASNAGVFKESEKDFMNRYVGEDPTQLFEKYRSGKGYEEVRKNNLLNLNQLKTTWGMPVTKEQVRQQESPQEVERLTKDKQIAIFDAKTKKFLRYK